MSQLKITFSMSGFSDRDGLRKLLEGNKTAEKKFNLNPFCSLLFMQSSNYPETILLPNHNVRPQNNNTKPQTVRSDIIEWFSKLSHEQKCACTMVKNSRFLMAYIATYQKWGDQGYQHHIYTDRKIRNFMPFVGNQEAMDSVMTSLSIAWMEQPILYFNVNEEESQKFFNTFIKWADEASDKKIFDYANKIKNKSDPEENLLWFQPNSYRPLYAWILDQFQRIITKNYFNKDNYDLDDFKKIKKLRLTASKNFTKKQAHAMLSMKLSETKSKTIQEFEGFQQKVKIHQDKYYEEAALLMDFQAEKMDGDEQATKKKKKKKNKNKKKNKQKKDNEDEEKSQSPKVGVKESSSNQNSNQFIVQQKVNPEKPKQEDEWEEIIEKDGPEGKKQKIKSLEQILMETVNIQASLQAQTGLTIEQILYSQQDAEMIRKEQQQLLLAEYLEQQVQEKDMSKNKKTQDVQNNETSNEREEYTQKANNIQRCSIHEQQQYDDSVQSATWSNNQTYTKSGQSHPEFSKNSPYVQNHRNPRSLSPEISPILELNKRKRKNKNKNSPTRIINRNHEYQHQNKTTMTGNQNDMEFEEQEDSVQPGEVRYREGKKESKKTEQPAQKDHSQFSQWSVSYEQGMTKNQNENEEEHHESPKEQQQHKKRKRKNQRVSLLKQLSTRLSASFINKQLNNFVDNISTETNRLWDYKIIAFERISSYISLYFPTSIATLFGSNAVGISLPTSDIDIMISNMPLCRTIEESKEHLASLAVQINSMAWIVSCSTYLNAKVPLIKLQIDPRVGFLETKQKKDRPQYDNRFSPECLAALELKRGKQFYKSSHGHQNEKKEEKNLMNNPSNKIIKADITINYQNETNFGAESTELMKKWAQRYPKIYPITVAFKYILVQRGFSSNFKGGIGSYCMFIMLAAFLREFEHLQDLEAGQTFMSALKFYGEDFENQIKSIRLGNLIEENEQQTDFKQSSFISLEETCQILKSKNDGNPILYNIQANPLRILDPLNNRIMSGSCYLYPQIKSQFRRIYKELLEAKSSMEKQVELTIHSNQIPKMLENKKSLDKWVNKYEQRSGFSITNILEGGF